jgi:hypothetical protein
MSQIVIAGAVEEISLASLTQEVDQLVLQSGDTVTDEELSKQVFEKLKGEERHLNQLCKFAGLGVIAFRRTIGTWSFGALFSLLVNYSPIEICQGTVGEILTSADQV